MIKLIWPRQAGKTVRLLEMADGHEDTVIICANEMARINLMHLAQKHGKNVRILTAREFIKMTKGGLSFRPKILIDQAEDVLRVLFERGEIKALSMDRDGETYLERQ